VSWRKIIIRPKAIIRIYFTPHKAREEMICEGSIDLNKIFSILSQKLPKSQKQLNVFRLNNTLIYELKENTFQDIVFDIIWIENNKHLETIHRNAFNNIELVTSSLIIENNPRLTSKDPDHSVWDILSQFVNIERLGLING